MFNHFFKFYKQKELEIFQIFIANNNCKFIPTFFVQIFCENSPAVLCNFREHNQEELDILCKLDQPF